MQWHRSGLIASWEFLEEHVKRKNWSQDQTLEKPLVEKHSDRRWGAVVIIKSFQLLPTILLPTSLQTTTSTGSILPASHGNMMHIALVGINNQMSMLQDRFMVLRKRSPNFISNYRLI